MQLITPKLTTRFLNRTYPTFLFWGVIGYIVSVLFIVLLAWQVQLNIGVTLLVSATAAVAFFSLAGMYKLFFGNENLVYYQQEIAILLVNAGMLHLINQPFLPYLDALCLAIGVMVSIGRWGCFFVGCCHGKPCECNLGVSYPPAHVKIGFPYYFTNLKLFPIPLVESLALILIVNVGVFLCIQHFPEGTPILWYTTAYGIIRFILEYFRGDAERPYFWYLSEAQWTTLGLMAFSLWLTYVGILPFYTWHLIATIVLFLIGIITIIMMSRSSFSASKYKLFSPQHLNELAPMLEPQASQEEEEVKVTHTSLGLVVSKGQVIEEGQLTYYYVFSSGNSSIIMNEMLVELLAQLLLQLWFPQYAYQISSTQKKGTYYILLTQPEEEEVV